MEFEVIIIGTDINAYYMARNTYEKYNKKAILIGKLPMNFTTYSNILDIEYVDNLWDKEVFLNKLLDVKDRYKNKKLILIGSNDTYVRLIVENRKILEKYYLFNYPNIEIINNLLIKENFYKKYSDILDIPNTYIYKCNTKLDINKIEKLGYPVILKPGDGVLYYEHKFEKQAKVYKLNSLDEIKNTINQIEESGYTGNLILQEFIIGDDTNLFDSIIYMSKNGNPWVQSFAQIGLQEHSKTGVGNCTLLINGYNQYNDNKITEKLVEFLKEIGYTGIAEFDLKYDQKDNKFKIFEINPRQARSSYYLTALGYNLVECLIDDLIYEKERKFKFLDEKLCLTFVPKKVIKNNVENIEYKNEVFNLYRKKKVVNPLKCKKDKNFKRKLWLFLRDINYIKKYKEEEW